jgi:hypothetical protein
MTTLRIAAPTVAALLTAALAVLPVAPALADERDDAFTLSASQRDDLDEAASTSTADLYEDELVTTEEFEALLEALVYAVADRARARASMIWEDEN